jgi:purine catabolism regulator
MVLTLDRLLAELGLELASGQEAAATRVRWVHSTELLDPTPWLAGGELLLTTAIQLDTPRVQRAFVRRLADHGIAGLGFGTGFQHAGLPESLLEEARERAFPVFEVPYELPFIAIAERASAYLVNEQYEALRRGMAIQGRLERLVLDECGLEAVVRAVAGAIGGSVGVLSAHGEAMAWHSHGRVGFDPDGVDPVVVAAAHSEQAALRRGVQEAGAQGEPSPAPFEPRLAEPRGRALALPVIAGDRAAAHAWLVAVRDREALGDFERLILQQAVTVVALELMRLRVERDTERRLAGDVLAEALTGRLHPEEVEARLAPFGIGGQAAVLAFSLRDPVAGETLLDRALARAGARGLVATRGALLCAVIDASDVDPIEVARAARAGLAGEIGEVRAAASRAAPTHSLRRSFHEARCALEAVRLANGNAPEVACHRDLGAFQLLLSLQDDDALRTYSATVLGPVEESENGYGGELLRSLDTFIEHNGHWERAAAALYCHRHTLRYRVRRVEQLTGRDFANARDRIEFWLALRAREMAR